MTKTLIATMLLLLTACSSEADDRPACTIAGLYKTKAVVTESTCGNVKAGETTDIIETMTVSGDRATLSIQGVSGGCTGTVDGCTWVASCDLADPDTGAKNGTAQYTRTFTATGFTGTSAIAQDCSFSGTVSGTRQ